MWLILTYCICCACEILIHLLGTIFVSSYWPSNNKERQELLHKGNHIRKWVVASVLIDITVLKKEWLKGVGAGSFEGGKESPSGFHQAWQARTEREWGSRGWALKPQEKKQMAYRGRRCSCKDYLYLIPTLGHSTRVPYVLIDGFQ